MRKKTEETSSKNTDKKIDKNTDGESTKNRGSRIAVLAYATLFWEFFKVGTFTIGGGPAMIPQLQHMVVEEKKWLDEEEMLDCIALGQSLPGVIAVNMATFIGYKQKGFAGAVIATFGVVLPAFLAIIIALALLDFIGENPFVEGAFMGIKAAVCGLIIVTAVKLLKQVIKSSSAKVFTISLSLASLLAVGFFEVTAILMILTGLLLGVVIYGRHREVRK